MPRKNLEESTKGPGLSLSRREFAVGSIAMLGMHESADAQQTSRQSAGTKPAAPGVTLEVSNPLGEIEPPPTLGLNPRLSDLNGKTIALMDNWKAGGVYLQDRFEELLKKKYPNVKILRTAKPEGREGGGRLIFSADSWYTDVANKADAFIYTVAD